MTPSFRVLATVVAVFLAMSLVGAEANQALIITDIGTDQILTANQDGSSLTPITSVGANPINAIVSGNKLYWTENLTAAVRKGDLDGMNPSNIWTGNSSLTTAANLAINPGAGRIYWTDEIADVIRSSFLDGSDLQTVIDVGPSNPFDLALDVAAGKLYWTESSGINIKRANLDGTSPETLVTTTGSVGTFLGLALDLVNGKMYWTHRQASSVWRANLDGTMPQEIAMGRDTPRGIAVDSATGFVFWAEAGSSDAIIRAELDGSNPTAIISGLDNPWSVELVPEPSGVLLFSLGGVGLLVRRRRR